MNHPPKDSENTPITARCPSCRKIGHFEYIGNQNWPEEVARNLGVPASVRLYICAICKSTVSEMLIEER